MPSLSIKDVPEPLLEAIRRRAARNHRSLQGELMAMLEAAVGSQPAEAADHEDANARKRGKATSGNRQRSFADAAAEFLRRFPEPLGESMDSTRIVREMRDTHYGDAWVMAGIKDGHWPPQPGDSEPIPGFGLAGKRQAKGGKGGK